MVIYVLYDNISSIYIGYLRNTNKIMGSLSTSWNIFTIILTLAFIVCLIYFAFVPSVVKPIISHFIPNTVYKPNANHVIKENYTLYTNAQSKHNRLIVIIPGGAGLFSGIENIYGLLNQLNDKLGDTYDIVTFTYPVRFKYTIRESMLAINGILKNFLHYEEVHAIGISFGTLLIGAFYHKESLKLISDQMNIPQIGLKFKSLTGICGMYEPKFNVDIMTWLFNLYIMRNTPAIKQYTCYDMRIPKLIISSKSDFLVAQSAKFIQSESCDYKIYDSKILPHAFPQFINLDEAKNAIQLISNFIRKLDELPAASSSSSHQPSLLPQ